MQRHPIQTIEEAVSSAIRQVPPAWPLSATVAVNPFLGQADQPLNLVAARLGRITGRSPFPQRSWFASRLADGKIRDQDLLAAIRAAGCDIGLEDLREAAAGERIQPQPLPLISDLAGQVSGTDWNGLIAERVSLWAGAWFDEGQALWVSHDNPPAWADWKGFAAHDLTPEIAGLAGFAAAADRLSFDPAEFIAEACLSLGLPVSALPAYFHALLLRLGGWSQMARTRLWQRELSGGTDETLRDLLAIRLFWELRLMARYEADIAPAWAQAVEGLQAPASPLADDGIDMLLLSAAEFAVARGLAETLSQPPSSRSAARPRLQAAFCIDVRSEVYRRALESLSPDIQTIGFAGFFGLATAHRGFASDICENRLPVLLTPGLCSTSTAPQEQKADQAARYRARAGRAWGRFRQAAVSSFAFVEAAGPFFASDLAARSLRLGSKSGKAAPPPRLEPQPDKGERAGMACSVLRAMSLTSDFAPLVILAGHGAQTLNNPHNSALHCGACGGYPGDVNARLLAGLLNSADVRAELVTLGIDIPDDTVFVAALHNTTTDDIVLYKEDDPRISSHKDLPQAVEWLRLASAQARAQRAARLPGCPDGRHVARRSRDWAETRPEWGLAGCKSFIAAPREMTRGLDLSGEAFLHDYDWRKDEGFRIVELILTAPVVVASWISLQYFGSCVEPGLFGAGNKVLHNVVGGFGVLEGNSGLLRTGLPFQSVHDGERFVHDPVRLTVCIAAPRRAIDGVLAKHPQVQSLFDNGWLNLYTLDDQGQLEGRYTAGRVWHTPISAASRQSTDP